MCKELKKAIIEWLLENENEFQRVSACIDNFRAYIYNADGNYLIGGERVAKFISEANSLLYSDRF